MEPTQMHANQGVLGMEGLSLTWVCTKKKELYDYITHTLRASELYTAR